MTASNTRPAGSQSSNFATSTSVPPCLACPAIRGSGSTPSTRQPAAWNSREEMPVPQPTSSDVTSRAGRDDAFYQAGGIGGPGPVVAARVGAEPLGDLALQVRLAGGGRGRSRS